MKISLIDNQNHGLNIAALNNSIAHKNEAICGKKDEEERRDIVCISPAGNKQNMLQQLMKQRQDLIDRKNSLSSKEGVDFETIRDSMEEYDRQIREIDEQIAQLQNQREENKNGQSALFVDKPKTEEEVQNERLNNIVSLDANSKQAEVLHSVKGQMAGKARVLESELQSRYVSNPEKLASEIADLKAKAEDIAAELGDRSQDIIISIDDLAKAAETSRAAEDEKASED